MPKGVYLRKKRTRDEILSSLRNRLNEMHVPEPNTGCWLFTGYVDELGYGIIAETKRKRIKAHRASYTVFKGEIPAGLDIMHGCDLRCCINPEHLTPGTHPENMADMVRKGRSNSRGRRFPKVSTTEKATSQA